MMTWLEVDAYLAASGGILLPVGSTEQHGPMGLIGTDALCATTIAERAAARCDAVVAPTLALTPAPFNTAFPGTISISVNGGAILGHCGGVKAGHLREGAPKQRRGPIGSLLCFGGRSVSRIRLL